MANWLGAVQDPARRDVDAGGRYRRSTPLRRDVMDRLTIGQLAKQAHVNRETVRYYERRRLLQRPSRSIAGYRVFPDDAVTRLRFIRHAKMLGFSLEEVRELLALRVHSLVTCDRVREQTQTKIADIERKIEGLQQMRRVLSRLVTACSSRRKTDACPILESLEATGDPT
jgi:Hg(II)-responsive transcriptional regulator